MKPKILEMSAFGPYKDKVEIDFKKIGNNGIFLITGDTGSGKTTIFDAIVFALFGETSGSTRQVSSVRSNFADNDTETYVKFTFSHKNKTYEIRRTPQYERLKKSGDGTTKNIADAYLECSGKVVSGVSNVNEKIEEILGINVKQFKQISMLAQGEFLKILFAESKDRTEVFRRIFDTNIYNSISKILANKTREADKKLDELKYSFLTNKDNIRWKNQNEEILNLNSKNLNKINIEFVLSTLKDELSKNSEELKVINKKVEKKEKELKKQTDLLLKIQNNNEKIDNYNQIKEKIDQLKQKEKYYKEEKKKIEKNEKIIATVLPKEENVERIEKEIENIKNSIENNIKEKEKIEKNMFKLQKKEKKINEFKNEFEKLEHINEECDLLAKEKKKMDDIKTLLKNKESHVKSYNELKFEYKEKFDNYLEEEGKFFEEQAGILAEKLEVNMPCPVCGSKEHPNIAKKSNSVLSKNELDLIKKELKVIEKSYESEKNTIIKFDSQLEVFIKDLKEDSKKFNFDEYERNLLEKYNNIIKSKNLVYDSANKIYKEFSGKDLSLDGFSFEEFVNEFNEIIKSEIEKSTKNKTLFEEYKRTEKAKLEELEQAKKEYENAYKSIGFKKESDYKNIVLKKEQLESKKKEVETYFNEVIANKAKLDGIPNSIKTKKKQDEQKIKEEVEEITNNLKEIKQNQININGIYENNKRLEKMLKENADKLLIQIRKFVNYQELSKLANGTLPGKRKIEFEQFVQATYFDMIIIEANKRLIKMTDGRYRLVRKENSDKASEKIGLELEIFDNYNGKTRDIKSLSGGESFKAALALSLGVSDIIQSYSGGVVIDTLFIDEGFGTLDAESREQAINTLNLLTDNNKLIGIISHVTELKERIDKKIIVERGYDGSKIKFEV